MKSKPYSKTAGRFKAKRMDVVYGLIAALCGGGVGLLYLEPWKWCVGSTVAVLLLGIAVGAITKGPTKLVGSLIVGIAAVGVFAELGHGNLAQGGLLTIMGGVLVGTTLQRIRTERSSRRSSGA